MGIQRAFLREVQSPVELRSRHGPVDCRRSKWGQPDGQRRARLEQLCSEVWLRIHAARAQIHRLARRLRDLLRRDPGKQYRTDKNQSAVLVFSFLLPE